MTIAEPQPGKKQKIGDVLMSRIPGMVSSHGPGSGAPPTARPLPRTVTPPGPGNLPRPAPGRPVTPPGRPNLPPKPGRPGMVSSHGPGSGAPPTARPQPRMVTPGGPKNLPPGRPMPKPAPRTVTPPGPGNLPRRPAPGRPIARPVPRGITPPGPTNLPPGGGMMDSSGPGGGNLPPMMDNGGVASHGPGSGAPDFLPMPEMDPNGGLQALPQAMPFDGGGFSGGFDPNGSPVPGGGIQDELLRRFMMQQGQGY